VLLASAVLLPLLLAPLAAARPGQGRWLPVLAPLPGLAAALLLAPGAGLDLPWLLFGARLGLDDTGRVLLLATSLVWLVAGLFAAAGAGPRGRGARTGFLLAMAGNLGVILAQDAATFFTCYALMSFAAYPFVVERGDEAARRAGRVYIALVVVGEVLVLSGLLAAAGAAPDGGGVALAAVLLWIGFGIKAGLVPLHASLPLAYGAAPTAGALALAGAMVNAGLLGWLRFLPIGDPGVGDLGLVVIGFGLAGAFWGVLAGVNQNDARVLLGYSSVSQMGLLAVGVGAGLAVPQAWPALLPAVLLFAVHHALAKAGLFATLGVVDEGRSALRLLVLLLPALALVGLPFTSGAVAKAVLKDALPVLPAPWTEVLALALPLATVGTTLLMARLLVLALADGRAEHAASPAAVGLGVLLGAVAAGPWWLPSLLPERALARPPVEAVMLWPVLAGVGLAVFVYLIDRVGRRSLRVPVPPGDLFLPVERLASRVGRALAPVAEPHDHHPDAPPAPPAPGRIAALLTRGEGAITRWELAGIALLVLALVIAVAVLAARS
jgi:formate hydrogenlyase subunit 3/multisubunit Na+/H+ antiporter MnhD subunit